MFSLNDMIMQILEPVNTQNDINLPLDLNFTLRFMIQLLDIFDPVLTGQEGVQNDGL